ncbi:MAG: hypothetical protein NWF03_00535 [Candidatus Bathyarchaeota archaeon]|nr:hypothetical protein [Candidatus Bathyarchaeota archaeon]
MQTSLATLLFVTSTVILACVVVEFAVVAFEQTLDTDSPQMDRIREMEDMILNQTDNLWDEIETLNQTELQILQDLP